jgi:methionyl-tRNA formyltransferase
MNKAARIRIVFAGTPEFSVQPLQLLIDSGLAPIAVLTQPDRPAGRGRQVLPGPVKQAAARAGIPVHQPVTLRSKAAFDLVSGFEPDLLIVVAYGLILPANILAIPLKGCWNIHASLLPRWRGAAPIQRAIEAGDRESGVCIMKMDEGLDTGPIIRSEAIKLADRETGGSLHDRLADLGAATLLKCVQQLDRGEPVNAQPQPRTGITYARKLDKAEARLDWAEPAEVLDRRIRAFNPWPVAWCIISGERTRIWKAELSGETHESTPGTVLATGKQGIDVATGKGVLRLLELQRPGKRRTSATEFLNASSLPGRLEN